MPGQRRQAINAKKLQQFIGEMRNNADLLEDALAKLKKTPGQEVEVMNVAMAERGLQWHYKLYSAINVAIREKGGNGRAGK